MKKKYYMVSILDRECIIDYPFLCEVVAETDTKCYGKNYIFREIITGNIILPAYYGISKIPTKNEEEALTYDNLNNKSYYRISQRKVLKYLKNISINYQDYLKRINDIENKGVKRVLSI